MYQILLPYWDVIIKIILNTLLISIPEEIYLVMITLIFMGEFDYWKEDECRKIINHWDYSRILVPSISVALIFNITRFSNIDVNIASTVCFILFLALIVITNDVLNDAKPLKWVGKAFFYLILAKISVELIELLYFPLVINGTGKTISQINSNVFYNFIVTLPARLIQFLIVANLANKKRTILKGNLLKYLLNSRVISILFSLVLIINLIFLVIMYKGIIYNNFLINTTFLVKILIINGALMFPIINISGFVAVVFYCKNRDMKDRKYANTKFEVLIEEIKAYSNEGNFEEITWKLNEIGMVIEEIASDLYSDRVPSKEEIIYYNKVKQD